MMNETKPGRVDARGTDTAVIELTDVAKCFTPPGRAPVVAIEDVSLAVHEHEFVVLIGPSGCGKSTLLYMVGGFEQPTNGDVLVESRRAGRPGPDRGIVFQDSALFPWLTVRKNVEFGLRAQGKRDMSRVDHYLRAMGLEEFGDAYPNTLSGGMKQRTAIARTLAPDPRIVLMDEPFAALDAQTRFELGGEVERICIEERRTFFFVTHGIREAVRLADRIIVLSKRPSTVREIVPVDLPRPRNVHEPEFQKRERYVEGLIE